MEIGASSACFYPLETEKSFELLCKNGFRDIEIFLNSPCETADSFVNELKAIKDYYGVNVTSLHPYESFGEGYNFFSHYYRRYEDACENYKRFFSAAATLGADYVIMHGAKHGADICDEEYAERFTRLGEIAMTFGQNGFCEPAERRKAKRFAGTKVNDAVLKTAKVISSPSAFSGCGLWSCSFCIAAIAKGVAALPTPKKLALRVAQISS